MPADVPALVSLIREFGIPLAFLAALIVLLSRRILVLGSELDRKTALYERELEYREARRVEERAGRVAVEARLERSTKALEDQAETLKDILVEIARGRG